MNVETVSASSTPHICQCDNRRPPSDTARITEIAFGILFGVLALSCLAAATAEALFILPSIIWISGSIACLTGAFSQGPRPYCHLHPRRVTVISDPIYYSRPTVVHSPWYSWNSWNSRPFTSFWSSPPIFPRAPVAARNTYYPTPAPAPVYHPPAAVVERNAFRPAPGGFGGGGRAPIRFK